MALFFTLCLFIVLSSCTSYAPCKIGMRLDDIQTDYIEQVQKAVLASFVDQNVPVTIGLITANGFNTGTLGGIAEYINLKLSTRLIELASHSVNHVGFTTLSLAAQTADLNSSANTITSSFPTNPFPVKTFITPYNQFNDNTLTALKATNYNTITAENARGSNIDNLDGMYTLCTDIGLHNGLYHYPDSADTATDGNPPAVPDSVTIAQVQAQFTACPNGPGDGKTVVVLAHFSEFAVNGTDVVNATSLGYLQNLIATLKTYGCEFRLLQDMSRGVGTTPTTQPSAAPVTAPSSISKAPTKNSSSGIFASLALMLFALFFAL